MTATEPNPKQHGVSRTALLQTMNRGGHDACDRVIAELNDMLEECETREAALRDAIRTSVLLYEDAAKACDFIEVPASEVLALIAAMRDKE